MSWDSEVGASSRFGVEMRIRSRVKNGGRRSAIVLMGLVLSAGTCASGVAGAEVATGTEASAHASASRLGSPGREGSAEPELGTNNALAIANPMCDERLQADQRANCDATGAPEGRYPSSNYSIDVHVDTGLDNVIGNFQALLAQIANGIWLFLIFILNLVLTLLGWALELNPFGDNATMGKISGGLERFYRVFTEPWITAAIVAIGAWSVWKGLGQRQIATAAGGLVMAIVCMTIGLIVIHDPRATVGTVNEFTNDAAQAVIAAPQQGSFGDPTAGYAATTDEVWQAMTLPGFVALNFSDVGWALAPPDAAPEAISDKYVCLDAAYLAQIPKAKLERLLASPDKPDCEAVAAVAPKPRTNAEIWLRSSAGSPAREALWKGLTSGELDSTYGLKLGIQGGGGAWTRFPLVFLIAAGLLGGILLLAWLAIRIFTQTAVAFVLVLATPVAMLMPAFGERGRAGFVFWGTTLLGALVSKLVYAALLAIVLFATTVVGGLAGSENDGGIGTMMAFLVMAGLWWSVFLKRDQLLSLISISSGDEGRGGRLGALSGYYQARAVGRAIGGQRHERNSGYMAGGVAGAAVGGMGERAHSPRGLAERHIEDRAAERLDSQLAQSREQIDEQDSRRRRLSGLAREGLEAQIVGSSDGKPAAHREGFIDEERSLRSRIETEAPREAEARSFAGSAEARSRREGEPWSKADLAAHRERIRGEVNAPLESGVHAWRVGMAPERYERLQGREREESQLKVREQLRADRIAFGAIPDRPPGVPKAQGLRSSTESSRFLGRRQEDRKGTVGEEPPPSAPRATRKVPALRAPRRGLSR